MRQLTKEDGESGPREDEETSLFVIRYSLLPAFSLLPHSQRFLLTKIHQWLSLHHPITSSVEPVRDAMPRYRGLCPLDSLMEPHLAIADARYESPVAYQSTVAQYL